MNSNRWEIYVPIIIVILVALIGFFVTRSAVSSIGWYSQLNKARINPPNWLFGIVWIILYIFIAIVWARTNYYQTNERIYQTVNWLFSINIILNLVWSLTFFGMGEFIVSSIVCVGMIVTTIMLIYYLRSDALSVTLMSIYLVWLIFALVLNLYVACNNPHFNMSNRVTTQ